MGRVKPRLAISVMATLAWAAPPASAAPPLGLEDCGPAEGVYQCSGLVETWDGIPLDTTITLPASSKRERLPASAKASAGFAKGPAPRRLPLVVEINGFANSKHEYLDPGSTAYTDNAFAWARDGYAVLTYTSRGQWGSCGAPEARLANPTACARGYTHLADVRYEMRDTQELVGRLVDQGYAHPDRIGVTGDSYGGGQTLALAALRDRVMLPDGRLVPWRSPRGRLLSLAAAAPVIPWSDLITAAAPNGRVSATEITSRTRATSPIGVPKASFVNSVLSASQFAIGPGQPVGQPFVPGRPMGYLAPPGLDPEADVFTWVTRTNAGEPYRGAQVREIIDLLVRFHSPYYIDPSHPPPPLFLAAGFTDDLFPVDEVLRFANRTRRLHPEVPVSLLLGDFGHQRAANKPAERERLLRDIHRWFDRYLGGGAAIRTPAPSPPERTPAPRPGRVTAYVQTCPRDEPSLGPFSARSFAALSRGTVRATIGDPQTILSSGGDPAVARAIDPATGLGDSCVVATRTHWPGTARYTITAAADRPVTLIGAPKLAASLRLRGAEEGVAQIATRLWDIAPDGLSQRLVARGTYRPADGRNRWYLHPGAWRFEPGHTAELELLGADAPYARPSNGAFEIEVRDLRAALPVR